MKIEIDWQKPLLLAKHLKIVFDEEFSEIQRRPGVYFFSRKFGTKYEPFYIGESLNLRHRLKTHLDSRKIADALRGIGQGDAAEIGQGQRYFHCGYLVGKRNSAKKCLEIVQRYLIEKALAEDLILLNHQLTRIPTHDIVFSGGPASRAIYPKMQQVQRFN